MFNRLRNLLRGTAHIVVRGAEPEHFLNLCAKEGLVIWAAERSEDFGINLKLARSDLQTARALASHAQCELALLRRAGLPDFARRFRRRYGLMLGVFLLLLTIVPLSQTIFVIEIEGNEQVTKQEILSVLRQNGIKPGVYGPRIQTRLLDNQVLMQMEELSFFHMNTSGIRAQVIVRERIPKPEIFTHRDYADLIATTGGLITRIELHGGQCLVKEGDAVAPGEVLARGYVDIEEAPYSEGPELGSSMHRAAGIVEALTWRTLVAKIPLETTVKQYDGEEITRYSLEILGKRVNFYGNGGISFPSYDKISQTKNARLRDGSLLPLSWERSSYRSYRTSKVTLEIEAAEELLRARLAKDLRQLIGEEGEVLREDSVLRVVDGYLELTLLAECKEQIAKSVPITAPPPALEEAPAS